MIDAAAGDTAQTLTWTLPHAVAGTMVLSLNAYVLLAGADFGGGVWDLLAHGKHRDRQRDLIAEAIGPIWEANHVWLILVVVLLFTCFPSVYAHLATALHVPITLILVGIVLRGSAFTFRTYDSKADVVQRRWGRIFSIASVATPLLLGICLGSVASGAVPMNAPASSGDFVSRYVGPWLGSPFAWSVGVLTLLLFAFLAAVYLTVEAQDGALRNVFRRDALQAQAALIVAGAVTLLLARRDAPALHRELTSGSIAIGMHAVTAVAAVTAIVALMKGHYRTARIAAAAQASFIVWGWAWSQFPYMIPPTQTITELAATRVMLSLTLGALAVGTAILLPSFVYLFWVFKRGEKAFGNDHPLPVGDDSQRSASS